MLNNLPYRLNQHKETRILLQGELTISSDMEKLMESLFMDHVPESWTKLAYPSLLGLAAWFSDLCMRLTELENWSGDFNVSYHYKTTSRSRQFVISVILPNRFQNLVTRLTGIIYIYIYKYMYVYVYINISFLCKYVSKKYFVLSIIT